MDFSHSICMAAGPGHLPDLTLLATFAAGSFVMRGAGCTINDMWDRNIDNKVERTRDRPITSGQVSMFDALVFLGGQLGIGLLILLQLNWLVYFKAMKMIEYGEADVCVNLLCSGTVYCLAQPAWGWW